MTKHTDEVSHVVNGVTYKHKNGNFAAIGTPLGLAENIRDAEQVIAALPWDMGQPVTALADTHEIATKLLSRWDNGDCDDTGFCERYDEVIEKIKTGGWPKGVETVAELANEVRSEIPLPQTIRDQMRWGDEGDEFDIHRVYSGMADKSWASESGGLAAGPRIVRLIAPFCGHSRQDISTLKWVGASAVILTDVLEAAGFQVEIQGVFGGKHDGGRSHYTGVSVNLKEAGQYVNLADIAFMLCHPVAGRTMGWRQWVFSPTKWNTGGYGQCQYARRERDGFTTAMVDLGVLNLDEDSIILDTAQTKEQCLAATRKALEEIENLIVRDEEAEV